MLEVREPPRQECIGAHYPSSMRRKWKHQKEMEPFTPGQIPEDKGELIKSLIQLKGFQRALGSRWDGCLENQTSQEGPGELCSHPSLFLLQHESKITRGNRKCKKTHQGKQVHSFLHPSSPSLRNLHIKGSEKSCSQNQSTQSRKILLKNGRKGDPGVM